MINKYRVIAHTSEFLSLKADAQKIFKSIQKKKQVGRNLEQSSQATQTIDVRSQNNYINRKPNNFHTNSVFTNLFSQFSKLLSSTDFYSLNPSIQGKIWSKGRSPDPMDHCPRFSPVQGQQTLLDSIFKKKFKKFAYHL